MNTSLGTRKEKAEVKSILEEHLTEKQRVKKAIHSRSNYEKCSTWQALF